MDPEILPIDRFLDDEGYRSPHAREAARKALVDAGLTNPRKANISAAKVTRVRETLAALFAPVCGAPECEAAARRTRPGRTILRVPAANCLWCAGSSNRRAARSLAHVLERRGVRHVLIVGGTRTLHDEIDALFSGTHVRFRHVDGAETNVRRSDADPDLKWADVVAIWAPSPLPHKVSAHYQRRTRPSQRLVIVTRRGISSLCQEIEANLSRGA